MGVAAVFCFCSRHQHARRINVVMAVVAKEMEVGGK